jgi:hypothetical protein
MRESTSPNQANGSTRFRLHMAMKLSSTGAVLPPWSLPKNVQLLGSMAISPLARSVAPLSISRSPSSRNRDKCVPLNQRITHGLAGLALRRASSRISVRYLYSFAITGADSR